LGYSGSPYNALLEDYERGMTAEQLGELFGALIPRQRELLQRLLPVPPHAEMPWLDNTWDEAAQWGFSLRVLADMGYDWDAGRQDKSVHPFTQQLDLYDVRITTRINPRNFFSALMASMHEGGHALYDQGFQPKDRRTPLASGPSLGIHESQSRLWENLIGRSLPFWRHYTPVLREHFPGMLDGVAPEQLYRALNRVSPGLIRVEADECTYNLHIALRFEIEVGLIEGRIEVGDIPELWNAKIMEYLDLEVPDDAQGCLQDIHWSHGAMGYFPTYALGNLYAAQLVNKMSKDMPDLWEFVGAGEFGPVLGWLREHVHRYGRRKTAVELVRDATGTPPSPEPYLEYLSTKYSALYG
jgi:carboxypeptidase Taq